jgi:hypothetical protein
MPKVFGKDDVGSNTASSEAKPSTWQSVQKVADAPNAHTFSSNQIISVISSVIACMFLHRNECALCLLANLRVR